MKRWMLGALVPAVALSLAACSSGSSSTGSTSPSSSSTSSSATTSASSSPTNSLSGSPINVGAIGNFSGLLGPLQGGMPEVFTAWADYVNANGGIAGHPVNVIVKDLGTGGAPSLGVTAATQLIQQDHVAAIFDGDGNDSVWLSIATTANVPVIGAYSLPSLADSDVFSPMTNSVALLQADIEVAAKLGKKFGIVVCSELSSCTQGGQLLGAVAKSNGLNVASFQQVSSTAPDYTAACQSLTAVNSYTIGGSSSFITRVQDACRSQGVKSTLIEGGIGANAQTTKDQAFDGVSFADFIAPYFSTGTPGLAAYRSALTKYAPSVVGTTQDDDYSVVAWADGELFQAAAQKASGAITGASVKQGFYALKNETLGGLTGPLNFTAGKPALNTCYFTYSITNGTYTAQTLQPACVNPTIVANILKAAGA